MREIIKILSKAFNTYNNDRKSYNKFFAFIALISIILLFFQYFYKNQFSVNIHIYNNITNFVFALLFYIMIDAINSYNNNLIDSIKKVKFSRIVLLALAYFIIVVPSYVINNILPNYRFFANPFMRLLSIPIMIILVTIFEITVVTITLSKKNNILNIFKNSFNILKNSLLKLTLLKVIMFLVIFMPAIILFILGNILLQPIALILLIIIPILILPVYAFCCNVLIKQIYNEKIELLE
jgi:hypothetical protein